MPSNKKSQKSAAEPTGSAAASAVSEDVSTSDVERVDLLDALAIGEPELPPLPVRFRDIEFSINRYYSPDTIWKWADLQRRDTTKMTPKQIDEGNRALLKIIIPESDHHLIDDILAAVGDRSIPEARRIYAYMNLQAGLTDKWGNPLAP